MEEELDTLRPLVGFVQAIPAEATTNCDLRGFLRPQWQSGGMAMVLHAPCAHLKASLPVRGGCTVLLDFVYAELSLLVCFAVCRLVIPAHQRSA